MIETIATLQQDIAQMQSILLYYENRILRKQIAIEEIIQGTRVTKGYFTEAMKAKPRKKYEKKNTALAVVAVNGGRLHSGNGVNGECQLAS